VPGRSPWWHWSEVQAIRLYGCTLAECDGDLKLLAGREHASSASDRAKARYTEAAEASESGERFRLGDCEERNDYSVLLSFESIRQFLVDCSVHSMEKAEQFVLTVNAISLW